MDSIISRRSQRNLVAALARLSLAPLRQQKALSQLPSAMTPHGTASSAPYRLFSTSKQRSLAAEISAPLTEAESSISTTLTSNAASISTPQWTPNSRRVGLLARKRGMATYFLSTGQAVPCTVLQVDANQVSAQIGFAPVTPPPTHDANGSPVKVPKVAPYLALQVAASDVMSSRGISKTIVGHLMKAGINRPKKVLSEFKISADAVLPLGTILSASHFVPGQAVDVSAKSRGKGFQGPMKRHGFSGLPASHGVSISHRSHGSTGQHQDPGRVFPGKKMAGRMGGLKATVHNLRVLRVDLNRQLILVQGNVPGPDGGIVKVSDAKRALLWKSMNRRHRYGLNGTAALPEGLTGLPFPAGTREIEQALPRILEWTGSSEASESASPAV